MMNKAKNITQKTLNVASPIASALSLINPAFLTIPVIASVSNELCAYFDSRSVEKRLLEFQNKLEEQSVTIERLISKVNSLDEHSQYVFRNNIKHLCLAALPETTETLINCLISYLMEDKQDMDEEICEIIQSCNGNDIQLLQLIKLYINEGSRTHYSEMLGKLENDYNENQTVQVSKEDEKIVQQENNGHVMRKVYTPQRWYDRNVIYGENTIFWKDFTDFFQLKNANDMGLLLNEPGEDEEGSEVCVWAYMIRSLLKFQSNGVVQLEFVTSLGTISQNNIDRFHITLFGQNILKYISVSE